MNVSYSKVLTKQENIDPIKRIMLYIYCDTNSGISISSLISFKSRFQS
jgi:hypothetical protein